MVVVKRRTDPKKENPRWTIANTPFDPNRYYTHLSMILFLIAIVLPRSFLKTALLLNTIFVGMMGNLIFLQNFRWWMDQGYPGEELFLSNFVAHTVPMFLSFIILTSCPLPSGETAKITVLLSALFLLWAAIPIQGLGMAEKIYDSYRVKVGVLTLMTVILTMSTCKSIEYFRGR
jgi:hypothetical protein